MIDLCMSPFVGEATILVFALGVATLAYLLCSVPMAPASERGARGLSRSLARGNRVFVWMEPLLRTLATHVSRLPLATRRSQIDSALIAAGEFGGLSPDEFMVFSGFSSISSWCAAFYFVANSGSTLVPVLCVVMGPFLPWFHLRSLIKARHKAVQRGLPAAIDLAALCMGAGLDFPGALSHVVGNMPDGPSPVREELSRVLRELSLGRTRKQALQALASRVNTDVVREFVGAVVQSEERGTPLSEVLTIQAEVLRNRRSVLAEEAAARAGVMFLLPMLMMVVSIVLLLMGPLVIEMSQGGSL